jgi:catechol 2,3-dioxygenase-like lactoylglutathione lyase family enzyme
MKIRLTSVFVSDQQKALDFYTETLGFETKHDIPLGEFRWLTVVSPEDQEGAELLLEPDVHDAARAYQVAIFGDGIPAAAFEVDDLAAEHARLSEAGVRFTAQPTDVGTAVIAVFDDTCGNLIQLYQTKPE